MSELVYEASVYSRTLSYKNFKGEENKVTLYFALDPLQLMTFIAGFEPKKVKSGNPARNNQDRDMTPQEQLEFVRKLAVQAAGTPSDDGESWEPFENFEDSLAGKAFLTKLVTSDGDRREFAEKVILAPFDAFVEFAEQDPSNTPADIQQFKIMQTQMKAIFQVPAQQEETLEERRARLAAELAAMEQTAPTES